MSSRSPTDDLTKIILSLFNTDSLMPLILTACITLTALISTLAEFPWQACYLYPSAFLDATLISTRHTDHMEQWMGGWSGPV